MASIKQVTQQVERSNEVYDLPIMDAHGDLYMGKDGEPSTIGVVGRDSAHYRKETTKFFRAMQKLSSVEQDNIDIRRGLARCGVVRWSGWDDDAPFPCEPENVLALLADSTILEQVEAGIKDHARFFTRASKS